MAQVAKQISNITIGEKTPAQHRDTFVVEVKFMHGDADGYEYETVALSEADEVLELLNFLERCRVRYPRGKGGCSDYTDVEGYSRFVEHYEEDEDLRPISQINWPYWDGQYCASYKGYTVHYYDENGVQYNVEKDYAN